jgi:hypothetical protein
LVTWARQAGGSGSAANELIRRAWRQLFHNQAHDSAAGCGVDEAHDDVKARYRWAEQLAGAARDQALAQIKLDAAATAIAFNAGPACDVVTVETMIPKALEGDVVARGPDGVARPVQLIGTGDERPMFEGEFAAGEIQQYLGGIDPRTPMFGKYISAITATEIAPGTVRLDVGLGEAPVPPESLVEAQKRVEPYLKRAERFKIVMHAGGLVRPALVQAGPAPELALVPITVAAGTPSPNLPTVSAVAGTSSSISVGGGALTVTALGDGSIEIVDGALGLRVRANDLCDEGDRGDLYHFDGVQPAVRPTLLRATVTEPGPIRARLVIEQELAVPAGLSHDRARRASETRTMAVTTTVTLTAGSRTVELVTTLDNLTPDHRLRALVHAPFSAERLDVDQGIAVVARPLDTATLGAGVERPAPTGQHQRFFDVTDGRRGVALLSRGLPEHEVTRGDGTTTLALTLLRSVGWLSRGDLAVIDHAAGPILPTPSAQELGPHRFEYAVVLHPGDWAQGGVLADARAFAAPAIAVTPSGKHLVPPGRALVDVTPSPVVMTAVQPAETGRGVVVRLVNTASSTQTATVRPGFGATGVALVDPLEREREGRVDWGDGVARLSLRSWEIVTLLFRA